MKSIRRKILEQEATEDVVLLDTQAALRVRTFGAVNWLGLWSLIIKEVKRQNDVWYQSILAPSIMNLLFFAVFTIAMGGSARMIGSVPFVVFLVPGLVMMSIGQNAFISSASALILQKIQGSIVDNLMPPLSPLELTIGNMVGAIVRGVMVGVVSLGALSLLAPVQIVAPFYALYHMLMGASMLALLGIVTGVWGNKFDHLSIIQSFVVMPATFLSGTFFSAKHLPEGWDMLCYLNPFFYVIDGFRYGLTGHADGSLYAGLAVMLFVNLFLFNLAYWMFARSSRLRP